MVVAVVAIFDIFNVVLVSKVTASDAAAAAAVDAVAADAACSGPSPLPTSSCELTPTSLSFQGDFQHESLNILDESNSANERVSL